MLVQFILSYVTEYIFFIKKVTVVPQGSAIGPPNSRCNKFLHSILSPFPRLFLVFLFQATYFMNSSSLNVASSCVCPFLKDYSILLLQRHNRYYSPYIKPFLCYGILLGSAHHLSRGGAMMTFPPSFPLPSRKKI